MHLASRMEQLAIPGTIRMTAEAARLVEGLVELHSLGAVPVKGLAAPVDVFELTGAGILRTRLQAAAARGLTSFVGRQDELEVIRQALGRARAGHGEVVALVGEPGIGKSRLGWEVTHSHRAAEWRVLEGLSVSYGKATAYLPVLALLKAYFQIETRDDERRICEKVTGRLLTLDPALALTVPSILALLAAGDDPEWHALDPVQRRRRTLEMVKSVLLREARVQPLLLIFEDLHWIDAETQALLDSLVESLPVYPILLLVNYRPEYRHGWGGKPLGERGRILEQLREAERVAETLDDQPRLGRVFAFMTQYCFLTGECEEAIQSGRRALALAAELGDFDLQVLATFYLGQAFHTQGDYRSASELFRQSVSTLRDDRVHDHFGLPAPLSLFSMTWLGLCLAELGEFAEGTRVLHDALRLAEIVNVPYSLIQAFYASGVLALRRG